MIYFDNAATTWPKPEEVYSRADLLMREFAFNAGRGSYPKAVTAQQIIDDSRRMIASFANTDMNHVYFTSTATEALNQIIFGLCLKPEDTVFVSPFEHNSIIRPLKSITGIRIEVLPFDRETWELDQELTKKLFLRYNPKAVFVSEVSNVTGYRLPWEDIFELAKTVNCENYTKTVLDCSQSYGQEKEAFPNTDFLVFNGHKSMYGIMGTAGWINFSDTDLKPTIFGGTGSDSLSPGMPDKGSLRYEAGTHNLPAIGSLETSLKWLEKQDPNYKNRLADRLVAGLKKIEGIFVYYPDFSAQKIHNNDKSNDSFCLNPGNREYNRRTNILKNEGVVSFNLQGYSATELAEILSADFGISLRSGYHCSPLVHEFIGSLPFNGTVRASLGYFNTEEEIDSLLDALQELSGELI